MLQHGHESVDDDPRIGRPSTSTSEANFERVREIMTSDRNKSVGQIASEVGISVGSCHSILRNVLNMYHVCQHLLPRVLKYERNKHGWAFPVILSIWLIKTTVYLTPKSEGMKHGASCTRYKKGDLFNGNRHFNLEETTLNRYG